MNGHMDASHIAIVGILTEIDRNGKDGVTAYFFNKLSPPNRNRTANDQSLLALICFLESFISARMGFRNYYG